MKTRYWILFFIVLLAVCGILTAVLFTRRPSGTVANIYRDGVCVYSVDLSAVEEPFTFTLTDERGSNTVRVERGRICVTDADCPDRVCVEAGWIGDSAAPIVCLPHRLVIRIEKTARTDVGIDAVAQ